MIEWLIKKGEVMAEVKEKEFFERLQDMVKEQNLVYVVEGPNIDIILNKKEKEYNYWDMVGTVSLDTSKPDELPTQTTDYKSKLESIGVPNGGSYEL
jgi:hypothetical protein